MMVQLGQPATAVQHTQSSSLNEITLSFSCFAESTDCHGKGWRSQFQCSQPAYFTNTLFAYTVATKNVNAHATRMYLQSFEKQQ